MCSIFHGKMYWLYDTAYSANSFPILTLQYCPLNKLISNTDLTTLDTDWRWLTKRSQSVTFSLQNMTEVWSVYQILWLAEQVQGRVTCASPEASSASSRDIQWAIQGLVNYGISSKPQRVCTSDNNTTQTLEPLPISAYGENVSKIERLDLSMLLSQANVMTCRSSSITRRCLPTYTPWSGVDRWVSSLTEIATSDTHFSNSKQFKRSLAYKHQCKLALASDCELSMRQLVLTRRKGPVWSHGNCNSIDALPKTNMESTSTISSSCATLAWESNIERSSLSTLGTFSPYADIGRVPGLCCVVIWLTGSLWFATDTIIYKALDSSCIYRMCSIDFYNT